MERRHQLQRDELGAVEYVPSFDEDGYETTHDYVMCVVCLRSWCVYCLRNEKDAECPGDG